MIYIRITRIPAAPLMQHDFYSFIRKSALFFQIWIELRMEMIIYPFISKGILMAFRLFFFILIDLLKRRVGLYGELGSWLISLPLPKKKRKKKQQKSSFFFFYLLTHANIPSPSPPLSSPSKKKGITSLAFRTPKHPLHTSNIPTRPLPLPLPPRARAPSSSLPLSLSSRSSIAPSAPAGSVRAFLPNNSSSTRIGPNTTLGRASGFASLGPLHRLLLLLLCCCCCCCW